MNSLKAIVNQCTTENKTINKLTSVSTNMKYNKLFWRNCFLPHAQKLPIAIMAESIGRLFQQPQKLFHTSLVTFEVQSGRIKVSQRQDKPITYEQSLRPHNLAHRKSWHTWNTTTIEGGIRTAETVIDDMFIRKFIVGTFHNMVYSEVIIKRQHNIIRIAMLLLPYVSPSRLGFLLGYSEEILSYFLQCPTKLEIQVISCKSDTIFKYI